MYRKGYSICFLWRFTNYLWLY